MYLNHKGLYLAEILVLVKSTRSVSRNTDRARILDTCLRTPDAPPDGGRSSGQAKLQLLKEHLTARLSRDCLISRSDM